MDSRFLSRPSADYAKAYFHLAADTREEAHLLRAAGERSAASEKTDASEWYFRIAFRLYPNAKAGRSKMRRRESWNNQFGSAPDGGTEQGDAGQEISRRDELRTWRDASGKHSAVAEFISLEAGRVRLKTEAGRRVSVPLERLSAEDQAWVSQLATTAPDHAR